MWNLDAHQLIGSCIQELGNWYNAALYFGPDKEFYIYRKINLATSERGFFKPGDEFPVYLQTQSQTPIAAAKELKR
jgi:predicted amidohydrolase